MILDERAAEDSPGLQADLDPLDIVVNWERKGSLDTLEQEVLLVLTDLQVLQDFRE